MKKERSYIFFLVLYSISYYILHILSSILKLLTLSPQSANNRFPKELLSKLLIHSSLQKPHKPNKKEREKNCQKLAPSPLSQSIILKVLEAATVVSGLDRVQVAPFKKKRNSSEIPPLRPTSPSPSPHFQMIAQPSRKLEHVHRVNRGPGLHLG